MIARAINLPKDRSDHQAAVIDPAGAGRRLYFQKVPEGKVAKNRVHLDVDAGGATATGSDDPDVRRKARDAHVDLLTHHGARILRYADEPTGASADMADPESNETCVV